jgi:hypothetical protein
VPNTLRNRTQIHQANQAERPPLRIVVVYDGMADLIRVNEIWSRLVARFKDEIQIVSCAWNFASLRDPQLRERAAFHAGDADLIVLSASGRSKLPDYIRHWIRAWLPWKKGRRDALVATLDHESPACAAASPLRNYLRRTAEQSGMDFFCNAIL